MKAGCTSRVGECLGLLGAGSGLGSCAVPPFRCSSIITRPGVDKVKPKVWFLVLLRNYWVEPRDMV